VTRGSYHHGALREALVATGLELARAGGPAAVVVREAARRVQVSPAAGYRHFADRDALLLAVRHEALGLLGARMLATADSPDPLLHFRGLGQGYVHFALDEPGLFRTFAAPGVLVRPGQAPPGADPFALLSDALDRLVTAGLLTRWPGPPCTASRCSCSTGCSRRPTPASSWTAPSTPSRSACSPAHPRQRHRRNRTTQQPAGPRRPRTTTPTAPQRRHPPPAPPQNHQSPGHQPQRPTSKAGSGTATGHLEVHGAWTGR
jgi:AcrR family transcriptional regulator